MGDIECGLSYNSVFTPKQRITNIVCGAHDGMKLQVICLKIINNFKKVTRILNQVQGPSKLGVLCDCTCPMPRKPAPPGTSYRPLRSAHSGKWTIRNHVYVAIN